MQKLAAMILVLCAFVAIHETSAQYYYGYPYAGYYGTGYYGGYYGGYPGYYGYYGKRSAGFRPDRLMQNNNQHEEFEQH